MEAKILKTEAEYEAALARIDELMDAEPGSPREEELELLALLVEKYEEEHYPVDLPDPVEAIEFRMEQEGLSRKDLTLYIGSQSKVSEVLNRKRPLSLTMIRALHEGLGIPAEVLLQELYENDEVNPIWKRYPFNEMLKRGYFSGFGGSLTEAKSRAGDLLGDLFSTFHGMQFNPIFCKHAGQEIDSNALAAWQAQGIRLALSEDLPPFSRPDLTEEFIRQVVRLSYYTQGPQMVKELLNKSGIHFIILPHLPKTYLDGACFYTPDGHPVIVLSLRYDRLDNFWFTVVHELAHLYLHMDDKELAFFDDTERPAEDAEHPEEQEADSLTRDMLIPLETWEETGPELMEWFDEDLLLQLATRLKINPAIIAGRIRWERNDYTLFSHLVGNREVRVQFPEFH